MLSIDFRIDGIIETGDNLRQLMIYYSVPFLPFATANGTE